MLTPIDALPQFVARDVAQSSTPASFANGPDVSVFDSDASIRLEPVPAALGEGASLTMHGHLWLSEQRLVFGGDKIFQIDYPSIALHAVSREVPDSLGKHDSCLYCQIDDHADDDESEVHELWIAIDDQKLESAFEALSKCAALHPSEDTGGNPFADIAPFGSGAALSDTGRNNLARFEAMLDESDSTAATWPGASNTLLFANLPPAFFESQELVDSMLALLGAYGHLVSWEPLAAFGRSVAVFATTEEASRVKHALDRLALEYEGDGVGNPVLRVFFASDTPLSTLPDGTLCATHKLDVEQYLKPPPPEREFLISPPGSPPVGWEPVVEGSPNTKTLAEDLMKALTRLAEQQELEGNSLGGPMVFVPESRTDIPSVMVHETEDEIDCPKRPISETRTGIAGISGIHTARPPL
ncbi:hypothetical protein MCUN1_000861 [Malassezia cuniculi]|uniref:Calcipressin-domain-containing protein n=1 Tax=Malassezia cuniculi TaxID=948313 RepID=A0AAF0J5A9_9BASI|nr:hypothetical protein MCUN1_000861 [Malassezia cuniculi]